MEKIRKLISKYWNDPVWSNVIAGVILSLIGAIYLIGQSIISKISFAESFDKLKNLLATNISIPLWLILACLILFSIYLIRKTKIKKNKEPLKSIIKKEITKRFYVNDKIPATEPQGSTYLKKASGILSIWAYVDGIHNKIADAGAYRYIFGYATNNGRTMGNPQMASYPNGFGLCRINPTPNNTNGLWYFWCNGIETSQTIIQSQKIVDGWHLFTIAWSQSEDSISFHIDLEAVGHDEFKHWPQNFNGTFKLGTWADSSPGHNWGSRLSNLFFEERELDIDFLRELYKNKPE